MHNNYTFSIPDFVSLCSPMLTVHNYTPLLPTDEGSCIAAQTWLIKMVFQKRAQSLCVNYATHAPSWLPHPGWRASGYYIYIQTPVRIYSGVHAVFSVYYTHNTHYCILHKSPFSIPAI